MGTRSIIVVTGKGEHRTQSQTVRLYRHWDGYPTGQLETLADATDCAVAALQTRGDRWTYATAAGTIPTFADMPARMFADFVRVASMQWGGFAADIDTDDGDRKGDGRQAVYGDTIRPDHFGNQGDLEWVYVVDVVTRTLTVYGGDYGDPSEHLERGPVDPRVFAGNMVADKQSDEYTAISALMDRLTEQQWTITMPAKSKRRRTKAK